MTTPRIEEKVIEFDDRYVTKAGCIHALACSKEGTQGVKDWLRTALTEAEARGAERVLSLMETRLQDKEGAAIIRETINNISK